MIIRFEKSFLQTNTISGAACYLSCVPALFFSFLLSCCFLGRLLGRRVRLVGGGGIGATMFTAHQRFDYDFVLAIIIVIIATTTTWCLCGTFLWYATWSMESIVVIIHK